MVDGCELRRKNREILIAIPSYSGLRDQGVLIAPIASGDE